MTDSGPKPSNSGLTRRDLLDAAYKVSAVAMLPWATGEAVAAERSGIAPTAVRSDSYPPRLQGIRGQTDDAMSAAHAMRDGNVFEAVEDTREFYDLVVVGAGMSGLAAAYFYRKALPQAKILILDGCDDFGGHARRNEFIVGGKAKIAGGGTYSLSNPVTPEGKALLADIGIDFGRFYKSVEQDKGLQGAAVFFDKESWGTDRVVADFPEMMPWLGGVATRRTLAERWQAFLGASPIKPEARADLLRIITDKPDFPASDRAGTISGLRRISYADYLQHGFSLGEDAARFAHTTISGFHLNVGARSDSFSAWLAYQAGCPGFTGLDLPAPTTSGRPPTEDWIHFPDGNAGIARLLVRWLVPNAVPGSTMEDSVLAQVDYSALDRSQNDVRVRLSSTVVKVIHNGAPEESEDVTVSYARGGAACSVRARTCVMASFNAIIPYLCPELPDDQKADLKLAVRKPLVWTTVVLNNWRAMAKQNVGTIYCPGSFFEFIFLDAGTSLGGHAGARSPDEPAVVYLALAPNAPGLPARDQYRAGRAELLGIDRETYETQARTQLQRVLGSQGFDADRDIAAITINRWAHGYACGSNDLYDPPLSGLKVPACVRARHRFGRIAIANSDAAGVSLTQAAFDQANRAVGELIDDVVRPQFWTLNPEQG